MNLARLSIVDKERYYDDIVAMRYGQKSAEQQVMIARIDLVDDNVMLSEQKKLVLCKWRS